MSAGQVRFLICDGANQTCSAEFHAQRACDAYATIRRQAKTEGWSAAGGFDWCPEHATGAAS